MLELGKRQMGRQVIFYHRRCLRQMFIALCLLVIPQSIISMDYRTQALRAASVTLNLEQDINRCVIGQTSTIILPSGQAIVVRIDEDGMVEHIGIPLFSDFIRQKKPSPVYDCIEYAVLDRCLIHTENDLLLQKIQLLKGSWQTVCDILPTDECMIDNWNEKVYQVTWRRNGMEIVNLKLPVDYELLYISSRRELEKIFADEVERQHVKRFPYHLVEELLQRKENDDIYVLPGESFLIKGLTRNTYYRKSLVVQRVDTITFEEERMGILIDKDYPAETMANLLVSTDPQLPDAAMQLELQMSSNEKRTVHVTLRQWLSYCESQGCIPYYIFDESDDSRAKAYLLMRNKTMGYNHLILLTCLIDDLVSDVPSFTGKAYLFIPNVEASQLFGSEDNLKANKKQFR